MQQAVMNYDKNKHDSGKSFIFINYENSDILHTFYIVDFLIVVIDRKTAIEILNG